MLVCRLRGPYPWAPAGRPLGPAAEKAVPSLPVPWSGPRLRAAGSSRVSRSRRFRALGFFGCAGTDPRPGAYAQSEDNATGPAHAVRTKGAREMTDTTSKRSDAGKRLREYQQVLGSFTRIASESLPLGALLHHAAAQAARVTDIKRAKVMRYRPEKGADCSRAPAGTAPPFPLWARESGLRGLPTAIRAN